MPRDDSDVNRRTYLKYVGGTAAAVGLAGCSDDGGDGGDGSDGSDGDDGSDGMDGSDGEDGDDEEQLPEPETREEHLQRANLRLNERAPWIFLNRQYSVYGIASRLDWDARRDERIEAQAISVTEGEPSVTITQSSMDSGLDPHDHRETPTDNIVVQAHDGVLGRNADGDIIDALATDYERLEDGRVRFEIRDGVTFHNGDELQPADVAYSVNRVVDPEVGIESPQSDQLAGVTGAEVVDGGVEVTSDGINPIVFSLFASYCKVVQQDWIESRESSEINSDMNGTGPFQVVEYEQDVEIVYEPYEDYWGDAPEIDELTIRAASESSTRVSELLAGETDLVVNVPPQEVSRVRDEDSTEVAAVPSTRVIFNAMRYDVEPFSSPEFRRALNYAIDLDSIIENILQGFADPTGQPTLEGFVGYNEEVDPYPQDVEQAEQLVEDSGHAGAEITLETPVGRYLRDVEIAQAVASQIDELSNVSCEVEQRDFGSLAGEVTSGNIEDMPHFYLLGWGNTTFDASQTIIPLLTSDGALSSYREDEEVDELMADSQSLPGGN
ncbi:peptide ABC transporter substrate-binding protein [Halorubrum salipaludis]|uniref:Peptide ABC transporter substrate-binding protein n=1 Tax=Halorubrum salipaludis TaxID=2032630 RepID=A0A2A2FLD2_9EURY|nr:MULTISPECIES: ABC transporter substrate-binding protein [Halorubrum]PAU85365.1 peptide ABC transporter substrate-binding protein [Halorubrum salipaludis]